jgi:hypothetical protein
VLYKLFFTPTTITIKNMYTYPLSTANIISHLPDTGLPRCFVVETSNFAVAAFLIERDRTTEKTLNVYSNNEIVSRYILYKYFSLNFNKLKTILILQLKVYTFYLLQKKVILKSFTFHQATFRVPPFEKLSLARCRLPLLCRRLP